MMSNLNYYAMNGKNECIKDQTNYSSPPGEVIDSKSVVKDLGVLMSNDCTFREQILSIIEKQKILHL